MSEKTYYQLALALATKVGKDREFRAYYQRLQVNFLAHDERQERILCANALIYCGIK